MKLLFRVPYEIAAVTIGLLFDWKANKAALRGPGVYELRLVTEPENSPVDGAVERWVEIWGPKY